MKSISDNYILNELYRTQTTHFNPIDTINKKK